jgi:hypothetical protein
VVVCCGGFVSVAPWCYQPARCRERVNHYRPGSVGLGFVEHCEGWQAMMDLHFDGRDVTVRLRDDVWQVGEPGTLSLTRTQAQVLRLHLNELNGYTPLDSEPEDG